MKSIYIYTLNNSITSNCSIEDKFKKQVVQQTLRISIFLHQPSYRTRFVTLCPLYPISILNNFYSQNSIYIFNGEILDTKKSFSNYNIKDNMTISIILSNQAKNNPTFIEKYLKLSTDENFQKKISLSMRKDSKKEIARIRDINIMKHELNRTKIGKLNFIDNNYIRPINCSLDYRNNEDHLKIDYDVKELSEEPLPVLW